MASTKRIEITYYLLTGIFWFATALPLALTVLLLQARGMNLFQVGLLMAIYSLTIVLLEVPTGGLADAVGRKRVTVSAYACLALSGVVVLFAFSFPVFLLAFILNGLGRALASGALDAWFVDSLEAVNPESDLQATFAKAGTITLLALGFGTLLGSAIPQLSSGLPADGTAVLTPLSLPVLIAFAGKILLLVLTILLVQESSPASQNRDWRTGFQSVPGIVQNGFRLSRQNPTLMLLFGASAAAGLALASLEGFWQPQFAGLVGGSRGNSLLFGLVMGGNFLVGMIGNLLATPISRRLRQRYALVCAIFQGVWGTAIILLALQTTPWMAMTFFWLAYFNMGVLNSPHTTLLNREIPSEQRSAMLSIASLASYLGAIIGSAVLGYLAEQVSISTTWLVSGSILALSLGLYWRVDMIQKRAGREFPDRSTAIG